LSSVGCNLVVEVVEQRGDAPELLVAVERAAYDAVDASTASAWRRSASLFVYWSERLPGLSRVGACSRVGVKTSLA